MTHINTRRDTAANWAAANPVLQLGERGHERDTRKSKTGDGVTAWNDLGYEVSAIAGTKADVGLDQVDNTSDMDKPISSAMAAALAVKASLASPAFTGNPTAPTATPGDNDTTLANTAFVQAAIAAALAAFAASENPVGSIKFSVNNVNPGTYIAGTTWVAWGSGRVPVGVDTLQTEFDTAEETGGEKTHTLLAAEIPTHTHALGGNTSNESSDHIHTAQGNVRYADTTATGGTHRRITAVTEEPSTNTNAIATMNMDTLGASAHHVHALPTNTGNNAGGGGAHNNLQPYITCYMWKRTA